MSRRRATLALIAAVALLIGAATLWQDAKSGSRHARILMLDPRTGATLHEHSLPGGYAIADLLARGRVAVASENGCPDSRGGWISVFDASLQHLISQHPADPCMVARLNVGDLRKQFEGSPGTLPDYNGGRDVTVRLGAGKIVETSTHANGGDWLSALTAYDASGRVLWRRGSLGSIGVVDVRDGRVVVPVFGEFTLGSD